MKCEGRIREWGPPRWGLQSARFDGALARVLGQVLQRRGGSGQAALTSEHYVRPSLSAGGLSEEKTPPLLGPHPQSVPSPASWGRHFPLQTRVEPSWSQVGISPLGSPSHPTPCHPQNLGFNVYFLIRMPATREPPKGPSVAGEALGRVTSTLSCPHLHRAKGRPPRAGGAPCPATTGV